MTESQVFEALGLTPGGDSGNTPEVAAPAGQEQAGTPSGEGGKEQAAAGSAPDENKTAAPEDKEAGTPDGGASSGGAEVDGGSEETPNRDPEASSDGEKRVRAAAAARRRQQEKQAAIDRAVSDALTREREAHKAEMDAIFQAAALKNTITGTPITNMDEFNTWKQTFAAAKLQQDLKAGGLTPEGLEQAISNSPVIQRMKEIIERDAAARRESDAAAAKAKIDAELQEIHKLDPSINTTEDLLNMPAAKEFYEYVRKGNTFLDAFYLANRQRLTEAAAESARQQTMNAARSKEHLRPAGTSRGAGAAAVPAEEMELFKLLNPKATEAEIQTYYNKTKSK